MYYEKNCSQHDITRQLGLSQATVSRLLKKARQSGIVRITITEPKGTFIDLERKLEERYGLIEAIVSQSDQDEQINLDGIGRNAAAYVETSIDKGEVLGLSSWSESLLAMVRAMHPMQDRKGMEVVQILGGLGNPAAEVHANQLTTRLSSLINAEAHFLQAPGVARTEALRMSYLQDPFTQNTMSLFPKVTFAMVGIGALEPSSLIAKSGNIFSHADLKELQEHGAVGDICMRFFNRDGEAIEHPFNARVSGIELDRFCRIPKRMAVAGGKRKRQAIRAALRGSWINILATDHETALWLAEHSAP